MEKMKWKLKFSACIGIKSNKECNISNNSEFQTGDSGIVSDQSSLPDHLLHKPFMNNSAKDSDAIECLESNTIGKYRPTTSNQSFTDNQLRIYFNGNLSSINETPTMQPCPVHGNQTNFLNNHIDYGPIHPYMKVAQFYKVPLSDTYSTVASPSEDDSQSVISKLFVPVKRSTKSGKADKSCVNNSENYVEHISNNIEMKWEKISSRILLKIFKLLSIGDILRCSQACRNWYFIAWQPTLWSSIDFSRWDPGNKISDVNYKIRKLLILLGGNKNPYCPLVHSIKLDKCLDVTDDSIIFISNSCPNLKSFSVRKCIRITNISIFHILSKCNEMKTLNIEGCKMVSSINTLPDADVIQYNDFGLSDINLSYCQMIDDSSLIIMASKFKSIEKLLLRNCKKITDIGISYVVRYCKNLRELSLNNLQKVSDESICKISEKINENLKYLSLANCSLTTDNSLISLSDYCCNLQYLNLHKCKHITDSGIMSLAISIQTSLVSLNISSCPQITNKSISVLSRYCTGMHQLDLSHCIQISDDAIEEVCRHIVNLKMININNTSVTIKSYDAITAKYCYCSIQHSFITDC